MIKEGQIWIENKTKDRYIVIKADKGIVAINNIKNLGIWRNETDWKENFHLPFTKTKLWKKLNE